MSKLAPGPWSWNGEFPIVIEDGEGYYVVGPNGIMPSGEANARLIAAAPELLGALKYVLSHTEQVCGNCRLHGEAAIAKAEGR